MLSIINHIQDTYFKIVVHYRLAIIISRINLLLCHGIVCLIENTSRIVSAARSLTCRDDLDSKWRLLLAENELSRVSLLFRISIGN